MGWTADIAFALILGGVGLAQQQNLPDAHENPAVQNAPDGKKNPPATEAKTIPEILREEPAVKSGRTRGAPPAPELTGEEAILGTWDLVPAKSKFNPGPGPRAEVRDYTRTPDGIRVTVTSTDSKGTMSSITYPWQIDGKEHPVSGSKLLDSILLKKVDNLTSEATLKHGDKVIGSERREFAADGKTMTIEVKDLSSAEHPIVATAVYQKR